MKKIALVTAGFLPVPAIQGGAVEQLVSYLVEENEKKPQYYIDLYTINHEKLKNYKYKYTRIIKINVNTVMDLFCRVINYITKRLKTNYVLLSYPYYILKKLKKIKYEKIIVENNMILYNYLYKRYSYNTKFYYHMHNNMNEPGKTPKEAKNIERTAEEILFVSNAIKKAFNYYTKSNRGVVLYNCIDFSIYDINSINNTSVNKDTNKDIYKFIYTGRICDDKGVDELTKAFSSLSKKYRNISLSIIGFGFANTFTRFEKKIKKFCNANNIKTYEFMAQKDLLKHIADSDCVVIPSKYEEAFGVVALEAMAMKKAIIATNTGGLTESLNKDCSIIIDKNNLEKNLYNAMEKLYKDRKYSKKIANNAYRRVKSSPEFDKKNYFSNFINIIGE